MLRRIVCFTALASILALTGCNGRSIDYLMARASHLLLIPTNQPTVLVVTSTPFPTRLVRMETPTTVPLTTPIPNDAGLTIEENEIKGRPDLDPLTFQPVRGSQQEVVGRHSQAKQMRYQCEEGFENHMPLMFPCTGSREYKVMRIDMIGTDPEVRLDRDGKTIFQTQVRGHGPIDPLQGLWVDGSGSWVLEVASIVKVQTANGVQSAVTGQIYSNESLLNDRYGYQEMFGYQLLNGKPFFFYKKDDRVHLSYDNQDLPLIYDEIPHYGCCSGAVLNPVAAPNWVGFFGRRNGVWYYTEIGKY